jgi:hypothetical protein
MAGMDPRYQFNSRTMLAAIALVALWCGVLAWGGKVLPINNPNPVAWYLFLTAVLTLPSAAVGVLAGRPGLGVLCGLASSLAFFAYYAYRFVFW